MANNISNGEEKITKKTVKSNIPIKIPIETKRQKQNNSPVYTERKVENYDDPWNYKEFKNGKNFYENYARENDRRKKEGKKNLEWYKKNNKNANNLKFKGNGFLMLLPGIAIPIDTDAGDSDDGNSTNWSS